MKCAICLLYWSVKLKFVEAVFDFLLEAKEAAFHSFVRGNIVIHFVTIPRVS